MRGRGRHILIAAVEYPRKVIILQNLFRIQAIMVHVQTIFNYPTLDAPMQINLQAIEYLSGQSYEATGDDLKYLDIFLASFSFIIIFLIIIQLC